MWTSCLVSLWACGGDDATGCASPDDCAAGELCINGSCMPAPTDAGNDARDATTDVGGEDGGEADAGVDATDDTAVDVPRDTFDAGPVCPGPGGARDEPIVLYTFEAPDDATTITDRAPAAPNVPLTANVGVLTVDNSSGGSIVLRGGQAAADVTASDALITEVLAAGSFAIEVWFTEDDVVLEEASGPERIVTLSLDSTERAFTIGQEVTDLVGRFRTNTTDVNAILCDEMVVGDARPPNTETFIADAMDGTTTKQVVYTFDVGEGRPRIYLNGVEVGDPSPCRPGVLNWPTGLYRLALGEENGGSIRTWEGVIHRVAIYARSMSAAEVSCWFGAGADADVL